MEQFSYKKLHVIMSRAYGNIIHTLGSFRVSLQLLKLLQNFKSTVKISRDWFNKVHII